MMKQLSVTLIGGPTAILELGGLRLLTDPTFDPPGSYEPRPGVHLHKTLPPALTEGEIGEIDLVLLSHDQHKDNLDDGGRELLGQIPIVLTTVSGAERLGSPATPLGNWESAQINRPDGGTLTITGLPAQHGPDGSEHLVGEVTGFLLTGEDLPRTYVSGDNASLDVVRAIAERIGEVDIAVLFLGGAQMPYLGEEHLTLPSAKGPEAAHILAASTVVPLHLDGWAHFTDGRESLIDAFEQAGTGDLLAMPAPGETIVVAGEAPGA